MLDLWKKVWKGLTPEYIECMFVSDFNTTSNASTEWEENINIDSSAYYITLSGCVAISMSLTYNRKRTGPT